MTNERTEETLDIQQSREQLKKRLWKYQALKREQEQLLQRLADIEATLYYPKIQRLTGMPAAPSGGNAMEDMAAQHIELQQKYQAQLDRLAAEQLAIEQTIAVLEEPTARMLMRYRYLDGLTWEEVCVKLTYSWRQTHRLHARALDALLDKTA